MKTPEQSMIEKVLNNEATPKQAKTVVRWFATPDGQAWLSVRMDADKERIKAGTEEAYMDHRIPSDLLLKRLQDKIRAQRRRTYLFRAAAILLPLLLIAGLYVELNSRVDLFASADYEEIYVPRGEQMQFVFQDGSRVLLNSESRLRYPRKFGFRERRVELAGEGWFEVAQKKDRPFIVDMSDVKVKVLGTAFDAKAYPEDQEIAVALEQGSVELTGGAFRSFTIAPGEIVFYNKETSRYRIVRPKDIAGSSVWKERMMDFVDAPLSEVLAVLSRSFHVTFDILDPAATNYQYTLRTKATDLGHVLRELEKIAPVRFEQIDDTVFIYMEK